MNKQRTFGALVLMASVLLGCGDDGRAPGSILVQWQVGGLQTCEDAGLAQVQVALYRAGGDERVAEQTEACAALETTFVDVPAGNYDVVLEGFAASSENDQPPRATYEGLYERLRVPAGELVTVPGVVVLQGKPAEIVLLWRFESGYACFNYGVTSIAVSLWGEHGMAIPLARSAFPCELSELLEEDDGALFYGGSCGASGLQGVRLPGLSPQRYTVQVFGLDEDGAARYSATAIATPGLGEQTCVALELSRCTNASCTP